jgi:gamma-glutamyltranspeptidase/glutathione hydrolase/leukotriene-C4 hydrolase
MQWGPGAAGDKNASLVGGLAVAVPLELKGLWKAQRTYGRAQWASLVSPAAALARNGFPAHPYLVDSLNKTRAKCARGWPLCSLHAAAVPATCMQAFMGIWSVQELEALARVMA